MFIRVKNYLYNAGKVYGIERRGKSLCVFFSSDFEEYQSIEYESEEGLITCLNNIERVLDRE